MLSRKEKRDLKNANHRRNERRREVLKILKTCPSLWKQIGDAKDLADWIRGTR
jgi:hypothetical protein